MASVARGAEQIAVAPFTQSVSLLLLAALTLIAVTATGLFQVMQTSRAATIGYELRTLEAQRASLGAEVRLLEVEIARRSRIEQIRVEAVERLGMVMPEETVRIAVTVPAPAVIPMPERYVTAVPEQEPPSAAWWERLLRRVPGFD
jgi:cell division protein FtsL